MVTHKFGWKYLAAPAVLLFAAAGPASAKVVLQGDDPEGWEVSLDGSINGFVVNSQNDAAPAGNRNPGLIGPSDGESTRVRTGLLPAVLGINIKAPTIDGIDMGGRIGIYPQIQNSNTKTAFFSKDGGVQAGAQIDMREVFFTADANWGQLLVGRTLSQFQGKNILKDMTLFGVGGVGGQSSGGTTLGRIGLGYVYPDFNARVQYTTPDIGGAKFSVGVYDPSVIRSIDIGDGAGTSLEATQTNVPRIEGDISWAGTIGGGTTLEVWGNGMWQTAEFDNVSGQTTNDNAVDLDGDEVTAWGVGGGIQLKVPLGKGELDLVGSGYFGEALGLTFQLDADALDPLGEEREHWGYYGQAQYGFGQGTKLGVSFGGNFADETAYELANRGVGVATQIEAQTLTSVMLSHDVNANFRLIAEYGGQTTEWFDGIEQDQDIISVGTFFFF